jgi:hypothetical protein
MSTENTLLHSPEDAISSRRVPLKAGLGAPVQKKAKLHGARHEYSRDPATSPGTRTRARCSLDSGSRETRVLYL